MKSEFLSQNLFHVWELASNEMVIHEIFLQYESSERSLSEVPDASFLA